MVYGGLIFVFFIIIILDCLNDIRGLIIPARKQTVEIIFLVIGSMFILGVTYLYAKTWVHIILGILGAAFLILSWARKGITLKGFNAIRGFGRAGNWNNLKNVQVSLENHVRVSFTTCNLSENIHYYKEDDYDRIITLLLENLPGAIVKIR
ncbi:hypothetical protein [Clostridium sp.]|jgi:hypothetical protein|uniref:hypothetical protein n=1 Tax=Clostridium sp. TaxID=1506 RepID=UPI003EE9E83B